MAYITLFPRDSTRLCNPLEVGTSALLRGSLANHRVWSGPVNGYVEDLEEVEESGRGPINRDPSLSAAARSPSVVACA